MAQILNPPPETSGTVVTTPNNPSTVITAQGLANALTGTVINPQGLANAAANCTPNANQASLTITKLVLNPNQLNTVPALNTLQFGITVINNGAVVPSGSPFALMQSQSVSLCINPGRIAVTETRTVYTVYWYSPADLPSFVQFNLLSDVNDGCSKFSKSDMQYLLVL